MLLWFSSVLLPHAMAYDALNNISDIIADNFSSSPWPTLDDDLKPVSSKRLPDHTAPNWTTIRNELKWTWLLHTYGFACVFFMLAFYAFFSILNLRAQLATRPYMSSINVFLCLLGVSRATCFLVDPYDSKKLMPEVIGSIMWDLAVPCLISSFSLIQLAFLQLTQLKLGPAKMRNKSFVSLTITSHFCVIIASDIAWAFQENSKIACYVCQTVFVCWGILLCVTFLYGGWKMIKLLRHAPPSLFQQTDPSGFEKKVQALGMLANCHNLAAMTAAAAAAVPSFLATPKIRITDENEQSYSYVSTSSNQQLYNEGNETASLESPKLNDHPNTTQNAFNCSRFSPKRACSGSEVEQSKKLISHQTSPNGSPIKTITNIGINHQINQKNLLSAPSNCHNVNKSKKKKKSKMGNGHWTQLDQDDQLEMNLLPNTRGACRGEKNLRMNGRKEDEKEDLTLISILNHIAYVNQAANGYKFDTRKMRLNKKSQIEKVLQGTCSAATLGLLLCFLELYRIYGPYGLLANHKEPEPWQWFIFQTISRCVEFAMGCFVANITKQPVNRHHYPYSAHAKHHRGSGLYFY